MLYIIHFSKLYIQLKLILMIIKQITVLTRTLVMILFICMFSN